jgi:hypothetical protein
MKQMAAEAEVQPPNSTGTVVVNGGDPGLGLASDNILMSYPTRPTATYLQKVKVN